MVPGFADSKSRRVLRHAFPTSRYVGSWAPENNSGAPNKSRERRFVFIMSAAMNRQRKKQKKCMKMLTKDIEKMNEGVVADGSRMVDC